MSNKRIYEVAADYGKPVNEVLDLLKKHNLEKKNFSGADEQVMAVIRNAYDKKPEPPKPAPKPEKKQELLAERVLKVGHLRFVEFKIGHRLTVIFLGVFCFVSD